MKRVSSELLIGGAMALIGVLILLQNLGLFGSASEAIWVVLFALGGLSFLAAVVRDRTHWWALIPAATLLSLALLMGLTLVAPQVGAAWGGLIFLGGMGLGFLGVYLLRPIHWWAIIPAGVLMTLGLVAGLSTQIADTLSGALFFGGLALTFGLVALAPPDAPRRWAFVPAAILLMMAVLVAANAPFVINFIWPTLLIIVGLGLLYRAYRHNAKEHYEDATLSQSH